MKTIFNFIKNSRSERNSKIVCNALIILSICFVSCKKAIEIDPPITQLVTSNVFANNSTATAAVLSLYAQNVGVPWNIHLYSGLSSDEFINYSPLVANTILYTNGLASQSSGVTGIAIWAPYYNYIYQVNAILENLANSSSIHPKVKQQLIAEAQFLRAYWYFYLVNFYGDVPLITTTDYKKNAVMPKSLKSSVYDQIVNDLKASQNALNTNYVDASDTTISTDRIRPNKATATALLSRVYLYRGEWANAEAQANSIIANTTVYDTVALNKAFLMNSKEAIWQLPPASTTLFTLDGGNQVLAAAPGSLYPVTLSSDQLSAFESNDARRTQWVNSFTNSSGTWYYSSKYKSGRASSSVTEYTMMLRIAEQYLIRAEARLKQNNNNGAIDDINIIRKRARLPLLPYTLTQTQIVSAIAHERQTELFAEGDRWFDIKRTGTVDNVMGPVTPKKSNNAINWQAYQQLYPIPPTDIQNNPFLVQNNGYQ